MKISLHFDADSLMLVVAGMGVRTPPRDLVVVIFVVLRETETPHAAHGFMKIFFSMRKVRDEVSAKIWVA